MQAVKEWAVGMCAAAIAGAVVKVLTPSGSFEKSVKTVVAVFLLCAMILPFCGSKTASQRYISTNFDEAELTEQALNDEISRQTAQYLKNSIEKIFKDVNFRPKRWENYRPLWYKYFDNEELPNNSFGELEKI